MQKKNRAWLMEGNEEGHFLDFASFKTKFIKNIPAQTKFLHTCVLAFCVSRRNIKKFFIPFRTNPFRELLKFSKLGNYNDKKIRKFRANELNRRTRPPTTTNRFLFPVIQMETHLVRSRVRFSTRWTVERRWRRFRSENSVHRNRRVYRSFFFF